MPLLLLVCCRERCSDDDTRHDDVGAEILLSPLSTQGTCVIRSSQDSCNVSAVACELSVP